MCFWLVAFLVYVMLVFSDDMQVDDVTFCVEDRLRSLGILRNNDELTSNSMLDSKILKGFNLEANWPQRKVCLLHRWNTMSFFATISVAIYNSNCFFPSDFSFLHQMREYVLSMTPSDAYKLLKVLLSMWQSRCASLIFEIVCLPFSSKQQPIWFFFFQIMYSVWKFCTLVFQQIMLWKIHSSMDMLCISESQWVCHISGTSDPTARLLVQGQLLWKETYILSLSPCHCIFLSHYMGKYFS